MAEWRRPLIGIDSPPTPPTSTRIHTTSPSLHTQLSQPLVYASQMMRTCLLVSPRHSPVATVDKWKQQSWRQQTKQINENAQTAQRFEMWKTGEWKEQLLISQMHREWLEGASAPSVTFDLLALTIMISLRGITLCCHHKDRVTHPSAPQWPTFQRMQGFGSDYDTKG